MRHDKLIVVGGLAALLYFFTSTRQGAQAVATATGALSGYGADGALAAFEVQGLAENMTATYFPRLSPQMLVAMAWIESSFRPTAFRIEPHVGDASVGLMQTLGKTAAWLWEMGYRDVQNGNRPPDVTDLADPSIAMYFGAAYLDYLSNYGGVNRDERFMVQAYNVGPAKAATLTGAGPYFEKYLAARAKFG